LDTIAKRLEVSLKKVCLAVRFGALPC
jgi:hypothetical protein